LIAVIQRVSRASVTVDVENVATIGQGLVVLVGVRGGDSTDDAKYLADKTANLRIFSDPAGKFNLSALDLAAEILVVSQFTLLGETRRGRRPSFTDAAAPDEAEPLLQELVQTLRDTGLSVSTGRFQQHMQVEIHNDGPVTIVLDTEERLRPRH